ncbi:hypothetical protein [Nocardia jiangxiensis]|uniref:hypothetical protein n=1 Tax=Nocardia jiangxiensis TaxID=282685 RepID=UPI00059302E1|nr:hypothetical protein [Nocardia jiangxiensis]
MANDSKPTQTGPLANLITEAQNGTLSVNFSPDVVVNADEFVYIERDCKAFKQEITTLQNIAKSIAEIPNWGLGESTEGLFSAKTLISRFRSKAMKAHLSTDTDDNIWDILDQHYKIIDDLETLHHTIAQQYCEQDAKFAAEYKRLQSNIEQSPILTDLKPGTKVSGIGKSS